MFIDKAKIFVKAGNGGNGAVSFRREKYVPAGGPDGGDGGRGASVIFEVDNDLRTLMDFKYQRKYVATPGGDGSKKRQAGKNGEDLVLKVPAGTIIRDEATGKIIADLKEEGERAVVARGGRGGKGNQHFANAVRQAPNFAKSGTDGEERWVILELKMIADVGLLGFPNVGKSTFLSVVTAAKPKIANYHFTTLTPNLGVVKTKYGDSFVLADIPGLIEGAAEGVGLGHDFLRHVERTRLLLHFLDVSGQEGRDPVKDFYAINEELKKYSEKLSSRKQIIVATKLDAMQDDSILKEVEKLAKKEKLELYKISSVTKEGVQELIDYVDKMLKTLPKEELVEIEDRKIYTLEDKKDEWEIKEQDGIFYVTGRAVQRLMGRVNIEDNESMYYLQKCLKNMGIEAKLKEMGVCEGDTVILDDWELEWYE